MLSRRAVIGRVLGLIGLGSLAGGRPAPAAVDTEFLATRVARLKPFPASEDQTGTLLDMGSDKARIISVDGSTVLTIERGVTIDAFARAPWSG